MGIEDKFKPEFQKRADGFVLEVNTLIQKIKKENPMQLFEVSAEDALGDFMDGLQKLSEIAGVGFAGSGLETPAQLSQKIDQQSASEAVVRIYGQSEFRKPLKRLADEARALAAKYGGTSSNFMSLLQSTDAPDGVENLGFEGEGSFNIHLNYSFK